MQISASLTLARLEKGDKGDKGDTGEPGVPGRTYKPVRIRRWENIAALDRIYAGDGDSDPWTDIVFVLSPNNAQVFYKCVQNCLKAAGTQPSDQTYSGYLVSAADYTVIATEVLLAQNAVINLLQGNRVTVCNTSGSVTAGLQGASGVQIWAGSATPGSAPFRVYYNGSFTATNANITGHITASVMDLRLNTDTSGGVPNGAISFDTNQITLPELSQGSVRTMKILNPLITRTTPQSLKLVPQSTKVLISTSLDYQGATSETKTISAYGSNGQKFIELLGINRLGNTVWMMLEL